MNRANQFNNTIDSLEKIVSNNLPGSAIAEQIIYGLNYCINIQSGVSTDFGLLKQLCEGGLPFKEIEVFDERTLNLVYTSFEEMKLLLKEKER